MQNAKLVELAQLKLPNEIPNVTGSPQGGFVIQNPKGFGAGLGGPMNTVGEILTNIVPYAMILGGIVLFGMLLAGGFQIMLAAGNQEKMAGGAAKIKNAAVGFALLFAVFWLAQIVQVIFKIQIL